MYGQVVIKQSYAEVTPELKALSEKQVLFVNCTFTGPAAEIGGECLDNCEASNCFGGGVPKKHGFGNGNAKFVNCVFNGDYDEFQSPVPIIYEIDGKTYSGLSQKRNTYQ